jgi:iron(III)-enterobactin esterase
LPDGAVPPANADGNFIIGPTHNPAPEMTAQDGVPQGTVYNFTMNRPTARSIPASRASQHLWHGRIPPTPPS